MTGACNRSWSIKDAPTNCTGNTSHLNLTGGDLELPSRHISQEQKQLTQFSNRNSTATHSRSNSRGHLEPFLRAVSLPGRNRQDPWACGQNRGPECRQSGQSSSQRHVYHRLALNTFLLELPRVNALLAYGRREEGFLGRPPLPCGTYTPASGITARVQAPQAPPPRRCVCVRVCGAISQETFTFLWEASPRVWHVASVYSSAVYILLSTRDRSLEEIFRKTYKM